MSGAVSAADEEPDDVDEWLEKTFPSVRPTDLAEIGRVESDRREAVERAEAAEAEARRLRRQLDARPATGLVVDGRDLGPFVTAGTYALAVGVGYGVGKMS